MALKGTIQDFGIADIFQLISQQRKSGVLVLNHAADEVRVHFLNGAVVRATQSPRPKEMMLGNMLLNAGVISEEALEQALRVQSRTLQKIGHVLEEMRLLDAEKLAETVKLQITETVFRLFQWESGTYEFEQVDVDPPPEGIAPIRAELILMEGVRMMDEWPLVRAKIPSYDVAIVPVKPLPLVVSSDADIGDSERRVHDLIDSGRDVQSLIYRSGLGEFETARAIVNLVDGGYVKIARDPDRGVRSVVSFKWFKRLKLLQVAGRALVYLALIASMVLLARSFDASWYGVAWAGNHRLRPTVAHHFVAKTQIRVLARALEVYRLRNGHYPAELGALVEQGILREHDLRYPFERRYFYHLRDGRFELLPPLR